MLNELTGNNTFFTDSLWNWSLLSTVINAQWWFHSCCVLHDHLFNKCDFVFQGNLKCWSLTSKCSRKTEYHSLSTSYPMVCIFFFPAVLLACLVYLWFFFHTTPHSKTSPSRILCNLLWSDCVIQKTKVVLPVFASQKCRRCCSAVLLALVDLSRENLPDMLTNILLWCCNLIIVFFNYIFIRLRTCLKAGLV